MNRTTFKLTALALIGLGICGGDVRADKAQLEERLRQDLSIQLEDVTIARALEQVGQKAGVRITLSPGAVWKLPEGLETRVSITLEGRLSESLEKMLNNFFLRYAVGSESLTIYPRAELSHILGRPTAQELKLLTNIYTNKMWISIAGPQFPEDFVQKILNAMAQEPIAIMPTLEMRMLATVVQNVASKTSSSSAEPRDANSPTSTPVTIASLLERLDQSSSRNVAWYVQGPEFPRQVSEIWIVEREEFWQAHLDRTIDVSFNDETGQAIVENLAAQGDLAVQFRGGRVPEALSRKMTLEVQNAKLIDVLDRALSVLEVLRTVNLSEGVVELHSPPTAATPPRETPQQAPSESPSGAGYVGKISIPMEGGKCFIEFMLRESDLTEELRQLRQQKVREILEQLSKAAKKQTQ